MSIRNLVGCKDSVRNFNIVAFADNLSEDTLSDFLASLGVPCAFIMHDSDTDEADNSQPKSESGLDVGANIGTHAKCHYHISFRFEGKKSLKIIEKMLEPIEFAIQHLQYRKDGSAIYDDGLSHIYVEQTQSATSFDRYFLHLDHPEKKPYKADDVRCFGGYLFETRRSLSDAEKDSLLLDIFDLIDTYDIQRYKDLVCTLRHYRPEWVSICTKNCYAIRTYLSENGQARIIPLDKLDSGSNERKE